MRKFARTCSLPSPPERLAERRVAQDVERARRALLDGVDEVARLAVGDLQRDAADVAADERPALPQRLGDGQAEALARRLLDHDLGERLEGVDLDRADVVEVVEDVDVRVAVRVRERRVVEVPALGVVGRHRADERELHLRPLLLDQPVGVDHAERVLPRVEARDLADHRARRVDPELLADELRVLERQRHVLRRQRVDRRRHDVHAAVHAGRHVVAHVEQRRRVALDVRQQPLHRLRVRRRDVDVAAPDPAARLLRHERVDRGRLRVVDDAEVPAARELARVHLVVLRPGRPLLLGEVLRVALEGVVHDLRGVEELLAPVDHLPLDLEPDVAHQRHERVEDLRDAAAERRGAQVDDAPALQRLGQLADLLHERAADDVGVVGEGLRGQRYWLEHGGKPTRRSRRADARRA